MSHSYYYDNAAYTFTARPTPTWASGIDSLLRLTQRNLIGTERGSARPEEELSFRSRPSPYTEKEREPMVSTARGFQQRRESEDQQAYAPKAESISYIRPYEAYELDFKTQLSTAKDSLVYMQKKIESEIENKLSAKDRDWENLKVQMKASKDSNEALSAQLERASRYQQTRIDDIGKKTDDLSLRLYDFATKKEVKAAEDRINSSIESRISNALRDFSQTIADLQRVTAGNRRELDDEIAELRRRLRDAERQQEEKELKQQTYVDDRLREAQTETRKNAKTAQDALGKLREDMEGKLDLHANNIVNTIRQEHTEHFNEYNEILANYQEAIKNNSTAIDRKAEAAEKEVLLNKERYERLQKEKAELEQQVEALRKNQEVFSQNVEAMLEKKIQEYDQGKAAEREEKEKVWDEQLKEHSQAQEEFKVAVDELKEKVATLEQAHKQAEEGEENKARESENEEKIAALQKELEEVNAKVESIMPLLGDEETQKKLAELDTKLKTIEEELTKRQEQFQKYDAQMQEYEERYQNIEVKYRESIEILNEKCTNIEEGANTRFGEVEKVSAENRDKLAGIGTNLQQLQESHRRLAARVDFLEKKLNVLRVEIQQKLAECAKEFKVHRDAIRELSEQRPSVAKTVENVGVNVVMGEKQMNTVMTGTDNVAYEVEVQTEYQSPPKVPIATEAKEEYKSAVETILAQDYNEPVLKQSSAIFNEGPKAQSEHMSEEEKERPNLNPLIQKTPRQVAFVETPESTKQPVLVEVKEEPALTEFGGRRKSPTVYGDISQQTDRNMVIEEAKESRRAVSLQVPMASRDFFSSSPHYLREDPLRSKDKKNIISTQGAVVEENISTKHFRQAEKFTVNLDDIAKIGQEEAPRPTYSEVIDYNTINFEDYKPQLEEESMPTTIRGGNSKAESDERPGRTPPKKPQLGGVFKSNEYSARMIREPSLEALPEVAESPLNESPTRKTPAAKFDIHKAAEQVEDLRREELIQPGEEELGEQREEENVEGGAENVLSEEAPELPAENAQELPFSSGRFTPPVILEEGGEPHGEGNNEVQSDEEDINAVHQMLSDPKPQHESDEFFEARGLTAPGAGVENVEEEARENVEQDEDAKEIEKFVIRSVGQPEPTAEASYKQVHSSTKQFYNPSIAQHASLPRGIARDKLDKIKEINKHSMGIYEQNRKQAKEESQKMFSEMGYVAGPSEAGQNEELQESFGEVSNKEKEEVGEEKKEEFFFDDPGLETKKEWEEDDPEFDFK